MMLANSIAKLGELGWFPKIVILGGEPTLHRDLLGFIEIANELSPGRVEIWSNGYRDAAKEILQRIRHEGNAKICEETIKACGSEVLQHADFFLAPIDFGVIDHRPCHNHAAIGCGISVDAEGYAACSIGGAIDSVLELGVRTKNLKDLFDKELVHKQTCALCDVCGRELGITSHHIAKSQVMHGTLMSPDMAKGGRANQRSQTLNAGGWRMKLAALCCTYLRPDGLGQLIECFKRQNYPLDQRELVILDDAGQYENQSGEGWRLVSIPSRFPVSWRKTKCLRGPDIPRCRRIPGSG